jgi:type IV pilus assembly protein PilA
MVVVLIIGILIAIALPTFLGARTRAQNRAAQSDLRNTLVAAKTIYTDGSAYTCATGGAAGVFAGTCTQNLNSVEPSLTYVVGAPALASTDVGVAAISATQWAAARQSASGICYYISDDSTVGTSTDRRQRRESAQRQRWCSRRTQHGPKNHVPSTQAEGAASGRPSA